MPDIGKRIREKRESLGMTQEELAQKLGYRNKSSIAKIETGTNDIVQSKVIEFADVLNTTVAYLMGWEDGISKNTQENTYYSDDDVKEAAQFLFNNPEYRVLFDATRKVKPEDIQFVKEMLDRFNKE